MLLELNFGFLGDYPVAGMAEPWRAKIAPTLARLQQAGIRAVLTLTEDNFYADHYRQACMRHRHEPLDDGEPASLEALVRSVTFINSCLEKQQAVVAHCLEGRGRTGMVLAAWLGFTEKIDGPAAVQRLRELRPVTVLTKPQQACIADFLESH